MGNVSPRTVITILCAFVTIVSIAATSQLESETDHVSDAGNFISLSLTQSSNPTAEQLFGAAQINSITSQSDYKALRVYYSSEQIFVVGTDAQGNDLTDLILSFGMEGVGERAIQL